MSESKHTPGPWKMGFADNSGGVNEEGEGIWITTASEAESVVVWGGPDDWAVPHGVLLAADAQLIAAAPEMLAMLKELHKAISYGEPPTDDQIVRRAALIKKAEGRA